jgi:hypothetical protein
MSDTANTNASAPAAPAGTVAPGGSPAGTTAPAVAPQLIEVKIDGKVEKWPLERVIAEAQKSSASSKRFQEANGMKAKLDAAMKALKEDAPEADEMLKELGIEDPMEFYRQRFGKRLQSRLMTEEERKSHEREQENKKLKGEIEKRDKEKLDAEQAVKRDEVIKAYDTGIGEALKAVAIPKNAFTIKRMCEVADTYLERGVEPNWKVVAGIVQGEFFKALTATLEESEDDSIFDQVMTPKLRKRLRGLELKKLRGPSTTTAPTNEQKEAAREEGAAKKETKPYMTRDEMLDYLEKVKRDAKEQR